MSDWSVTTVSSSSVVPVSPERAVEDLYDG